MFNLEKREKIIILFLLTLLIAGLCVAFYQKKTPSINVNVDSFSPDTDTPWQSKKININEADEKSLEALKGIGKSLAGRIVEYRSKNGSFHSIEELKKVRGIGDKLFGRVKDKVCVD